MKNIQWLIFGLVLTLTIILRLGSLNFAPPSLNWDEVSIGYNAYSILKTGHDEWGKSFPISFQAYGDFKLPGYVYLDTLFISVLGLNEWGVRLPSALAGIGTVLLLFFIVFRITKSKMTSLVIMFLSATTPWLLILSRIGLEANLALFFIVAAFYLLLCSQNKPRLVILSALFYVLSLFTYNSSRVVVLPYILTAVFLFRDVFRKNIKASLIAISIVVTGFLIITPSAILQDSSARFRWTTILDEGAINRINELRGSSAMDNHLSRIRYNKVTYILPEIFKNYISHFSPSFLYIVGGSNYQYSVPGQGLMLWVTLPLFLYGLYKTIKSQRPELFLMVGWLLISPLPAAITRDAPHSLRALFMIPPFLIISGYGLESLVKIIKHRHLKGLLITLIILGAFLQSGLFIKSYLSSYRSDYSWSWQYGYQEMINYAQQNQSKYDRVVFTKRYGEPHEFFLFYSQFSPKLLQEAPDIVRYQRSDWFWVDRISKYEFINDWEIKDRLSNQRGVLLITSPGNYPQSGKLLKTTHFLNGEAVFDIVEL